MKRIEMFVSDNGTNIERLLTYIQKLTNEGHSFIIDVDIGDKTQYQRFDITESDNIREIIIEKGWT